MEFRKAGMEDLALVAEYRKKMIVDSGQKDTGIDKELEEYTREKMEDGSLVEWLAEEEAGRGLSPICGPGRTTGGRDLPPGCWTSA